MRPIAPVQKIDPNVCDDGCNQHVKQTRVCLLKSMLNHAVLLLYKHLYVNRADALARALRAVLKKVAVRTAWGWLVGRGAGAPLSPNLSKTAYSI